MRNRLEPCYPLLRFVALLSLILFPTCNGPSVPLQMEVMTVANHNASMFPMAHGADENPTQDCNVCHGGFDSFSEFTCLNCHYHAAEDMNPLHSSMESYSYESTACYGCHPDGTGSMSRDSHAQFFPIDTGTNHEDAACVDCHTNGDFTAYTCLSCHEHEQATMDPAHAGVTGYAYESSACRTCHPDGTAMSRDDHDDFPISTGTVHQNAGCSECHTTGDYKQFSCLECHEHAQSLMDPAHTGVSGYQYATSACISCHPDGTTMSRDDHDDFPISTGSTHSTAECGECHTTGDYSKFSCIDCHDHSKSLMDPAHSGVSGYKYDSNSCRSCHPDGTAMSRSDHDDFPISTGSTHSTTGCSECHTTGDYSKFSCIDCHDHSKSLMDPAHSGVSGYKYDSNSCRSCHPDGTAMSKSEHSKYFPITSGDHSKYGCSDCHQNASSYSIYTCINCHDPVHTCSKMDAEHRGEVSGYSCSDSACYKCHPRGVAEDD